MRHEGNIDHFEVGNDTESTRDISVKWSASGITYEIMACDAQKLVHALNIAIDKHRTKQLNRVTEKLKGSGLNAHSVKANEDGSFSVLLTEMRQ